MNNLTRLLIAIAVSSLGFHTRVIADDTAPVLSAEQVADLLLSPDRDDHRRGVKYVVENKPDLTTQLPRLIEGLTSGESLVQSACGTGLWHGEWDSTAMDKHVPQLLQLLFDDNSHTRRGATSALNRIVPIFKSAVPELVAKVQDHPHAIESVQAIWERGGLSRKDWVMAWLPLTISVKDKVRQRSRYEIISAADNAKILVQLGDTEQPDAVLVAILEMLSRYHRKPKHSGDFVIRSLEHSSSEVRGAAIAALSEIPHDLDEARHKLIDIATTDSEELRVAAIGKLLGDPSLRKNPDERSAEEKRAVAVIYDAFSDSSSVVRRAACSIRPMALDRKLAEKLIERLKDSDSDVRIAAHSALGTMVGFAIYAMNHDPAKMERYYRGSIKEQSDSPEQAQEVLHKTMADIRESRAAARLLLQSVEDVARKHNQEAVRDLLRQIQTEENLERVRQSIPAYMRVERGTK